MQNLHEQYSLWREKEPGKYLRQPEESEVQRYFSPGKENAPLPALLRDMEGLHLAQLTWGFIPSWRSDRSKDDPLGAVDRAKKGLDIGRITWNASSETMFDEEKRTWKDSAHDRRCVIFLDGYFENHHQDDKEYPFYISPMDRDCMAVAGLWDIATINGKEYVTCAILTQEANEAVHQINNHGELPRGPHRMPIVLQPDDFDQWMAPIAEGYRAKITELYNLIKPPAVSALEYITVAELENTEQAQVLHTYDDLKLDLKELNDYSDEEDS